MLSEWTDQLDVRTGSCSKMLVSQREHKKVEILQDSQNPALNGSLFAVLRFNCGVEVRFKAAVAIRPLQSLGDGERVLLVGCSSLGRKCPVPERRIDFCDRRAARRNLPPVERPEMDTAFGVLPDVARPRDARVGNQRIGAAAKTQLMSSTN